MNGISSDLSDDEVRTKGDGASDDTGRNNKRPAKNINENEGNAAPFWENNYAKEPTMLERKSQPVILMVFSVQVQLRLC